MKIILASASPRRRELMKLITNDFYAVSTNVDETIPNSIAAEDSAAYLASIKAGAAHALYPDDIVIGCDTIVLCKGNILGKPKDKNQCREYIKMLSGNTHTVITGCAILSKDKSSFFDVRTDVTFRKLSDIEIEEYISTDEPYDKAGGYAVQGKGALLIEKINGDYFNVVGLPVSLLNAKLKEFNLS